MLLTLVALPLHRVGDRQELVAFLSLRKEGGHRLPACMRLCGYFVIQNRHMPQRWITWRGLRSFSKPFKSISEEQGYVNTHVQIDL